MKPIVPILIAILVVTPLNAQPSAAKERDSMTMTQGKTACEQAVARLPKGTVSVIRHNPGHPGGILNFPALPEDPAFVNGQCRIGNNYIWTRKS